MKHPWLRAAEVEMGPLPLQLATLVMSAHLGPSKSFLHQNLETNSSLASTLVEMKAIRKGNSMQGKKKKQA